MTHSSTRGSTQQHLRDLIHRARTYPKGKDPYGAWANAETLAIRLGDKKARAIIHQQYGKIFYDGELPPNTEIYPSDILDPYAWDLTRDDLDQTAFNSLYENHNTHPIYKCRKAELLHALKNYDEALTLLNNETHTLARGIKAKIHASLGNQTAIHTLTQNIYQEPLNDDLKKEGVIYLFEALIWLHYARHEYIEAFAACCKAEVLVQELGLEYRSAVIQQSMNSVRRQLGQPVKPVLHVTGSVAYNVHVEDVAFKQALVNHQYPSTSNPELALLQGAVKAFRAYRYVDCLRNLTKAFSTPERKLYALTMTLTAQLILNDRTSGNPARTMEDIHATLPEITLPQAIERLGKLAPTGLAIINEFVDHVWVKDVVTAAPVLINGARNSHKGIGVFVNGVRYSVPTRARNAARDLMLGRVSRDDAWAGLTPMTRSRVKKVNEELGIRSGHDIIVQDVVNECVKRFRNNSR